MKVVWYKDVGKEGSSLHLQGVLGEEVKRTSSNNSTVGSQAHHINNSTGLYWQNGLNCTMHLILNNNNDLLLPFVSIQSCNIQCNGIVNNPEQHQLGYVVYVGVVFCVKPCDVRREDEGVGVAPVWVWLLFDL